MSDSESVNSAEMLATLTAVIAGFEPRGMEPVLIGGMALTVLGSSRFTRDCDFLLSDTKPIRKSAVHAMYEAGFELITRWDKENYRPLRLLDNAVVAACRVDIDDLDSAFFWNERVKLRVDLIFRLSLTAEALASRAKRIPLPGGVHVLLAAPEDLLKLKRAALKDNPDRVRDKQDLIFLRSIMKPPKERPSKRRQPKRRRA